MKKFNWEKVIHDLIMHHVAGASLGVHKEALICRNDKSVLLRILRVLLKPFNPNFKDFGVTLGSTIYLPERHFTTDDKGMLVLDELTFRILAHELQHVADAKWLGWTYLLPHVLAVPMLIGTSFASGWVLAGLIAAAAVLASPLPNFLGAAYCRALAEAKAYAVSEYVEELIDGRSDWKRYVEERYKFVFGASSYYWPMPLRSWAEKLLASCASSVRSKALTKYPDLAEYGSAIRKILDNAEIKD